MEKKNALPMLKLCSSMAIFGTIGIFVKYLTLPSGFLVFLRASIGFLFLLPFVIFRKNKNTLASIKANLLPLILSGAALGANWVLLFEAYRYTDVSIATLCYYLAPVFIVLFSPIVLRERLTAQNTKSFGGTTPRPPAALSTRARFPATTRVSFAFWALATTGLGAPSR